MNSRVEYSLSEMPEFLTSSNEITRAFVLAEVAKICASNSSEEFWTPWETKLSWLTDEELWPAGDLDKVCEIEGSCYMFECEFPLKESLGEVEEARVFYFT